MVFQDVAILLNVDKCKFMKKKIDFLTHEISAEGIIPDQFILLFIIIIIYYYLY